MITGLELINELPRLAAGMLMLALAMWFFYLDPGWRTGRAFALYMVLRGTLNIVLPFAPDGDGGSGPALTLGAALAGYLHIAVPFAALAFALHLARPASRIRALGLIALAAIALVLELMYLLDHTWFYSSAAGRSGPLVALIGLTSLAYVAVGVVCLMQARQDPGATRRRGLRLLGFSSMLFTVYATAFDLVLVERGTITLSLDDEFGQTAVFRIIATVAAFAVTVWMYVSPGHGRRHRTGPLILLAAFVSGFLPAWVPAQAMWDVATFINGTWTMIMPLAAGVALTQYQVFRYQEQLHLAFETLIALLGAVLVFAVMTGLLAGEVTRGVFWLVTGAMIWGTALPLGLAARHYLRREMVTPRSYAARVERLRRAHRLASVDGPPTTRQHARLDRLRHDLELPAEVLARLDGPVYVDNARSPNQSTSLR